MDTHTIQQLKKSIKGDVAYSEADRIMYSTDASVYQEKPSLVVYPKSTSDIVNIVVWARKNKLSIIPRGAGTSLAGQVVGDGVVVDISKHLKKIIELNVEKKWVKVQPGVVLDELNMYLKPFGLFFAPETSTANRCNIGGMVGNNACGSHSLVYGSTREHLLEVEAVLSDGNIVSFGELSADEFSEKMKLKNLEGEIYRNIYNLLSDADNCKEIDIHYPVPDLKRRNSGYALDILKNTEVFAGNENKFNFCSLLAGSEGTLCFFTELKLNLEPLPPPYKALVCSHHNSISEALYANLIALKCNPVAIELMDETILQLSKNNLAQQKNRFFINGEPAAVLIIEFAEKSEELLDNKCEEVISELQKNNFGYHYPIIKGNDINKVWSLRKAGLGILSNVKGDAKPITVIEDTAVLPDFLPQYIADIKQLLEKHDLLCVYHAHVATGELHLRPVINLKTEEGVRKFETISTEVAKLVKKYKGSISGEHGDGRLRANSLPIVYSEKIMNMFSEVKNAWDSENIFNPGKIINAKPITSSLRYKTDSNPFKFNTIFRYEHTENILRAAEQCNGSADCRKSATIGGLMCPSYMATQDEKNSTRARANLLRYTLSRNNSKNPFINKELQKVMLTCLACKGCKNECPSNVDMTKYRAEFFYNWYKKKGIPLRTFIIGNIAKINEIGQLVPKIYNAFVTNALTSKFIKCFMGFSQKRSLPTLSKKSLSKWLKSYNQIDGNTLTKVVYLYIDEFTNYNDVEIGKLCVKSLNKLGYYVKNLGVTESGRAYFSKGMLKTAKRIANKNIKTFGSFISEQAPLIGIEPSAILSFRDEYPSIVDENLISVANKIEPYCLLFEEFISMNINNGSISSEMFTTEEKFIEFHGHCHQKSLVGTNCTIQMLSLPKNYHVNEIKSGCCGMAGSFGYEKNNYKISQQIGELVLFPAIRATDENTIIAANGTSCRTQILDGTGRKAMHPIEIFYKSLK
ncbi:MAG: FAD-binding and (Fe-S)-binding domain-containing protein [Bacteroidales bacterium]|jgi:FAD/FMN-containing dehydrogenase/Fe-S oxidoreductase